MSWSSRRATLVVAALAVLGAGSAVQQGFAQRVARPLPAVPPGAPATPKKEVFDLGSLTLPRDEGDKLSGKLAAAIDQIKVKDWDRATRNLQDLVGLTNDVFVEVLRTDPDRREVRSYVSARQEAARMIGDLPKEGRQFYEAQFGGKAAPLVKQARTNNDWVLMGQVVNLYLHTDAGAEAANWLGTYLLDRGDFRNAARYFSLLLGRAGPRELSDKVLLKAAYTFQHADDRAGKALVFKEMERRRTEIKLREEALSAGELETSINKLVTATVRQNASDVPIYRSAPNRTAIEEGGIPFLDAIWKRKTTTGAVTLRKIKEAESRLATRNLPDLSAFHPVTATVTKAGKTSPLIIFRSFFGIHAVNLRTSKLEWDSPSDWSLERVLDAVGSDKDSSKSGVYESWLNFFVTGNARPQILFENSVLGTLSADSRFVYAIEDLALPPPAIQAMTPGGMPGVPGSTALSNKILAAVNCNKLQAFSLAKTGALDWELGGEDEKGELASSYFLGPPLPLNDRLYVLTEKQQEIRLTCIDPVARGKVLSSQLLANVKNVKLSQDPLRRIQAAHLAYGEGILVVPTNAGAVFGVDLLSGSLLWACPYRAASTAPATETPGVMVGPGGVIMRPGFRPGMPVATAPLETQWLVTAPVIQEGKVVFTAPDDKSIHCLNLRDGLRLWSQPRRADDLFLAGVYNGKALIVGKTKTRALSLANGNVLWELDTGLPSGEGAASNLKPGETSDVIYYLPVRESVSTHEPEVCAINVDRGIIHAHTRSRKKDVPGNLLFYEGTMVSQSHDEVVAYPQLEVKLNQLNAIVSTHPDDPDALTERGDYLLDRGDLAKAVVDFRKALRAPGIAVATRTRARDKLYEALTELLQLDFDAAEEHLGEYEELCKIDLGDLTGPERAARVAEERRRRANFLCLVGKGREKQNRLVEAFEKYLELGQEARKNELIQVVDEPSVKAAPDVWSQGRIAAMVANASDGKQKQAVEALIKSRWDHVQESREPSLDELRQFVQMFGSLFDVGKEARLVLAERLMEDPDLNSLLEAEQQLSVLRSDPRPELAARAVEALARLNTRKGLLEDAAYYYRLLGQKYPRVTVAQGKTGADFLDDLATDKRFLPYLDVPGGFSLSRKHKVEAREHATPAHAPSQVYEFAQEGEPLPFFARNRLGLRLDVHQLRLSEGSGEDRWSWPLTHTQFAQIATLNGQGQPANQVRFRYQNQGHLVVLQLGHLVFGIDPLNKGRVLWERNLSSVPAAAGTAFQSLTIDPRDQSVVLVYPDGWVQRLAQTGPLQGGVICLQKRDALEALDPVTGRTLWTRSDVGSRTQVFGDDQHVFAVGLDENGDTVGSRAFRAYDGVSVRVQDFARVYARRVQVRGRTILASETDAGNQLHVSLYDVLEGKDLWKQTFPPGSTLLRSEAPGLVGVVEATGNVHVFDLGSQKEVFTGKLDDPKHADKPQAVYLLADRDDFYLAINGPTDPNVVPIGGVQSNLQLGTGLQSVPVNGHLYCFSRATGKRRWIADVSNQMLVTSRFEEMPLVLLTARYVQWQGGPAMRNQMNVSHCQAFEKKSGKIIYDNKSLPLAVLFHDLSINPRLGKVELTGQQLQVTFSVVSTEK